MCPTVRGLLRKVFSLIIGPWLKTYCAVYRVNVLVLWNTYYIDVALSYLREQGETLTQEDIARLSPLGHEHINMVGRYHFHLPESLKNGGIRPLRLDNSSGSWAETYSQ